MSNKVFYTELNPQEFEERLLKAPIAYLPMVTLEWHRRHMPLGADGLISSGFFIELAKKVGGIVLPMLFLAPDSFKNINQKEYYGMDFLSDGIRVDKEKGEFIIDEKYPFGNPIQLIGSAYWVKNDFFKQIIEAILKQLKRAGFKIVVAHGHGPSVDLFNHYENNWRKKFELELYTCWEEDGFRDELGIQTDHAASNETSLMMAIRKDLVNIDNLPRDMDEKPLGIIGKDPRKFASEEIGKKTISLHVDRMEKILKEKMNEFK